MWWISFFETSRSHEGCVAGTCEEIRILHLAPAFLISVLVPISSPPQPFPPICLSLPPSFFCLSQGNYWSKYREWIDLAAALSLFSSSRSFWVFSGAVGVSHGLVLGSFLCSLCRLSPGHLSQNQALLSAWVQMTSRSALLPKSLYCFLTSSSILPPILSFFITTCLLFSS